MSRRQLYLRFAWWVFTLAWVDALARRAKRAPARGILMVRVDGLGDLVLWLPAAAGLRERYEGERITLLANEAWAELAKATGIFDEIWTLNRRRFVLNPGYRLQVLRRVAEAGFRLTVYPAWARDFLWGDAIVRASGADERVGYRGCYDLMTWPGRILSDRWYTCLLPVGPGHAFELNAALAGALEADVGTVDWRRIAELGRVPRCLEGTAYYVVAPGARQSRWRWPVERFAAVVDWLHGVTGWVGCICGSPSEREIARVIISRAKAPLIDVTGETSLLDLTALLAEARLVIANESGTAHLGAALRAPVVCVTGGGHYGRFVPYTGVLGPDESLRAAVHAMECFGCNWNCRFPRRAGDPAPCVRAVDVDVVVKAVQEILPRMEREGRAGMGRAG